MDLKNNVLYCVQHPEALERLFGDGRLVEEALQKDIPISDIADLLGRGKTEHTRDILRFFLEQQEQCASVDISKRLALVKECLKGVGWYEEKDLLLAIPYGVFKPYFDVLFSQEHIADTLSLFASHDDYMGTYMESEDVEALGCIIGHVSDPQAQKYMKDLLLEYGQRLSLYGWLDHPVLGEMAYLKLKTVFIKEIEQWKEDCPDLLKRMQKEQLTDVLDQLGVVDTSKPAPFKKM